MGKNKGAKKKHVDIPEFKSEKELAGAVVNKLLKYEADRVGAVNELEHTLIKILIKSSTRKECDRLVNKENDLVEAFSELSSSNQMEILRQAHTKTSPHDLREILRQAHTKTSPQGDKNLDSKIFLKLLHATSSKTFAKIVLAENQPDQFKTYVTNITKEPHFRKGLEKTIQSDQILRQINDKLKSYEQESKQRDQLQHSRKDSLTHTAAKKHNAGNGGKENRAISKIIKLK